MLRYTVHKNRKSAELFFGDFPFFEYCGGMAKEWKVDCVEEEEEVEGFEMLAFRARFRGGVDGT
jgi:hypothetical protein